MWPQITQENENGAPLHTPVVDDFTAAISVVATLLILELDELDPKNVNTDPAIMGVLSWWTSSFAYYGMLGTLATSIAGSFMEIDLGRLPRIWMPTTLLALSSFLYVLHRELQAIIVFFGLIRDDALLHAEWEEEGLSSAAVPPPVAPHLRLAVVIGTLAPLNLFLVLTPVAIRYMFARSERVNMPGARRSSSKSLSADPAPALREGIQSVVALAQRNASERGARRSTGPSGALRSAGRFATPNRCSWGPRDPPYGSAEPSECDSLMYSSR